ncbi:hypothetical protein FisN_24Lh131 [Fistulifera solaris]|uniref:Uncharacterized protein n=1 Tax=Fistulifera solaris TaxID=1519565 RepID=A0A1Z5K9D2_FISSO|nr:hypothetical protein FisN_24Lh131 [Fistulifera solaris]|eukprot:GAX22847.1 hypothetical protein FisN_24Lh131 [Fistulifera solaris]
MMGMNTFNNRHRRTLFLWFWITQCLRQASADEDPQLFVTGTTPFLNRKDSNPFAPDRTSQAPYVHWTCYDRQKSTTPLQCCQTIYQMIQTDPETLRWRTKQKGPSKFDKKDFLQYCTKNLRPIPNSPHPPGPRARYTLVRVPEGTKLNIRNWSQIFGSATESRVPTHQWSSDDVISPIAPSRKARQLFLPSKEEEDERISSSPATFSAQLQTVFVADEDYDTKRYLRHTLTTPALSETSVTIEMQLLLFLPEGVALGKQSRGVTPCITKGCEVETRTALSTQTSLTQLDVVTTQLTATLEGNSLQWMTQLILEDDESYTIPAPILHYGKLIMDDRVLEFDGEATMANPIVTDLEEAWKGDEL